MKIIEMEQAIRTIASAMNLVLLDKTGPAIIKRHQHHVFDLLFPRTDRGIADHPVKRPIGSLTLSEEEGFMPSVLVRKNEDIPFLTRLSRAISVKLKTPVRITLEKKASP
ncbi:MAG: hypothetical protein WCJ25_05580 [Candidatus Moraniibacteriota bacterium]